MVAIALDGVQPTHESAADGSYPLTRPFLLLTKGEPTPQAKAFLEFLTLPESQATIEDEVYIPVKAAGAR